MEKTQKERVGIRLDTLHRIIDSLESNLELKDIFGPNVSKHLFAIADGNDFRIEEGGGAQLERDDIKKFLDILNKTIEAETNQ